MDDRHFRKLLDWLGLSWAGYYRVRKGVKKRITRHMQELGRRSVDDYIRLLDTEPVHKRDCERLLKVGISRFFRDRPVWEAVETCLLPALIARSPEKIKVWSAGCARGEEVYSLEIVWDILRSRLDRLPELDVWATDVNPELLEQGAAGRYSRSSLKEAPGWVLERYFTPDEKGQTFTVSEALKRNIRWRVHDLLSDDPPDTGFGIIFLRNNLLTYYEEVLATVPLQKTVESIEPGGYLVIGAKEEWRGMPGLVPPLPGLPQVLQKQLSENRSSETGEPQSSNKIRDAGKIRRSLGPCARLA